VDTNLLDIVKQNIATYDEGIFAKSQRLKAFFTGLAKDESKPLRLACCIEAGAYNAFKSIRLLRGAYRVKRQLHKDYDPNTGGKRRCMEG
jgi:hypothetical protein